MVETVIDSDEHSLMEVSSSLFDEEKIKIIEKWSLGLILTT